MNPDNPVIKLCVAGMEAEWEGKPDVALALFQQAWEQRQDEFDGCIAAHYLARHQPTAQARFHWNQLSLELAQSITDERVQGFYPSLYLNMAKSYEEMGNDDAAREYYHLAATQLHALPDSPYKNMVRYGIGAGQERQDAESGT